MKLKVIQTFKDKNHNCIRNAGDEFAEGSERANELIKHGVVVLISADEEKTKEVETAVKEEPKEVAVEKKKKTTPNPIAKGKDKNAKK